MPALIDLTLRQAINLLHAKGLKVKELKYVRDFAENAVLEQLYEDAIIEPGTELDKGSKINLILGLGQNPKVHIPFVIGMTEKDAINAIYRASFNVGSIYHTDGDDETHNRVYKQTPDWSEDEVMNRGRSMRIWLRSDEFYNFDQLILLYKPDTTSVKDKTPVNPEEF